MAYSAFISYDLANDDRHRIAFEGEIQACPIQFSVLSGSMSALASTKQIEREKYIRDQIGRCDLLIVLVSEHTAASSNVDREISIAKGVNVPFFGVYVDGAEESTRLPATLAADRVTPYDWPRIGSAVKQVMSEGKHHVFR